MGKILGKGFAQALVHTSQHLCFCKTLSQDCPHDEIRHSQDLNNVLFKEDWLINGFPYFFSVVCQSCYGAETAERKCCNTCNDVREAYRIKTWKFDPRGIEQCRDGLTSEIEERALKEGCQIYGYLEVNRVGGSFHIAPGKSFIINHIHVHDVNPFASTDFNVTHQIKHLSFGQHLDLGNRLSSF